MERDISAAEATLGSTLPSDYRESLTRHDGQELDQFGCSPGFVYGLNLYPLTKVVARQRVVDELLGRAIGQDLTISTHGPVREVWWDRLWVPVADDGNNNYCCLDLNPAAGGRHGQIIQVWNESHLRTVLAGSFREWLAEFTEELENDGFVYSESHNGLISLEDAIADGVVPR